MAAPVPFIVAILPDATTVRRALLVNRQLVTLGESKLVFSETAIPHLSLTHVMLDPDLLSDATKAVCETLLSQPVAGEFHPFLAEAKSGYVFWDTVMPNLGLTACADRVVKALDSVRKGPVPIGWPMDEIQREMHRLHGYPNLGKAFRPHITVGVSTPGVLPETLRPWSPEQKPFLWHAHQIVLGRAAAQYGALAEVTTVIAELSAP